MKIKTVHYPATIQYEFFSHIMDFWIEAAPFGHGREGAAPAALARSMNASNDSIALGNSLSYSTEVKVTLIARSAREAGTI